MKRMRNERLSGRRAAISALCSVVMAACGREQGAVESNRESAAESTASTAEVEASTGSLPPIVLDGRFEDWAEIGAAAEDPIDAPDAEIDLGSVSVTSDAEYVYLSIELRREVNVQRLDGSLYLIFDVDGNAATGGTLYGLGGADAAVVFSPPHRTRPEARHMGVGVVSATHREDPDDEATWLNIYDTGFFFAPTYASDVIECRVTRGSEIVDTPPLFAGESMRAVLVMVDVDGDVVDRVEPITHEFASNPVSAAVEAEQTTDPLVRTESSLRVISWNVKRGAMLDNPEPFRRIVSAVMPDVILLQEIPEDVTTGQIKAALATTNGDPEWHVAIGAGGGDLRSAVISRLAMSASEPLALVQFPENPERTVRTIGTVIEHHGARMLMVSVHLKCCGRIGSSEDETRLREIGLVADALKAALESGDIDGIIVAGDFNLVGGYGPLARLTMTETGALGELTPTNPMRLDGRSNVTWADPDEPFVPGRLDFILISSGTVHAARSFVFDSTDLESKWLNHHGLQPGDAAALSDHRPVVVDVIPVDPTAGSTENE